MKRLAIEWCIHSWYLARKEWLISSQYPSQNIIAIAWPLVKELMKTPFLTLDITPHILNDLELLPLKSEAHRANRSAFMRRVSSLPSEIDLHILFRTDMEKSGCLYRTLVIRVASDRGSWAYSSFWTHVSQAVN